MTPESPGSLARENADVEPAARGPFVGRQRELCELLSAFEEAVEGRGRFLLICGEPGIGKTSLAAELAARLETRGALILWGRCWEAGGAPAYWPWVQVLRACVRSVAPDVLAAALATDASRIAEIAPELQHLLPPVDGRAIPPPLDSEQGRFHFFDALASLLRRLAEARPMVVVLDDLHAAEAPSLLLLQFVARELSRTRLLVVGIYRDTDVPRSSAVGQLLAEIAREGKRLPLRGLTRENVEEMIERLAGAAPPEGVGERVHRATEGNPFFVDELVRQLLAEDGRGGLRSVALPVPRGVGETIRRRLGLLSERARHVLSVASTCGGDFEPAALQFACDCALEDIMAAVDECAASGILVASAEHSRRYTFSHALIRETLYEDLPHARRLGLHRAMGEALERLYANDLDPHVAELAHHFQEAASGGSASKALEYSERAARRAARLAAHEDAAAHYERALDALAREATPDEGRRCEILLALATARNRAGDVEAARADYRRAREIAERRGDAEKLARAALGTSDLGLSMVWLPTGAVGLLERALRALGGEESPLAGRVMSRLSLGLYGADQTERATALAQRSLDIATKVADPGSLAGALIAMQYALWTPDSASRRLAMARQLVQLADQTGDRELALVGRAWRLWGLLELEDVAAVDLEIEASAALAAELRQPRFLWHEMLLRGMRALLDGRFADAEDHARRALELGQKFPSWAAPTVPAMQLALCGLEQGRPARDERALLSTKDAPMNRRVSLLSMGRPEEMRTELEHMAARDFSDLPRDYSWSLTAMLLARAAVLLEDAPRAARLYDLLLPYAQRSIVTGPLVSICFGPATQFLAMLSVTVGELERAARHFEDALERSRRMGARPRIARTALSYARMLARRARPQDRKRSLELLETAVGTARALGMRAVLERALELQASLLAAMGSARPPPQPPERRSGEGADLFRQEGEYWTLAFEGKTFRLRDSIGLQYLAALLRHPDERLHVLELIAATSGGRLPPPASDAGPVLDLRAKTEYRRRLAELRAELDVAEENHDAGRAERLRHDLEFLTAELARGLGLAGRSRRAVSQVERTRQRVHKAIHRALARIERHSKALERHLASAIHTGTFCSYAPRTPISWEL